MNTKLFMSVCTTVMVFCFNDLTAMKQDQPQCDKPKASMAPVLSALEQEDEDLSEAFAALFLETPASSQSQCDKPKVSMAPVPSALEQENKDLSEAFAAPSSQLLFAPPKYVPHPPRYAPHPPHQ